MVKGHRLIAALKMAIHFLALVIGVQVVLLALIKKLSQDTAVAVVMGIPLIQVGQVVPAS